MNFQLMSKQRKFLLISSAVGFISMFLPWVSISMFGYTQSANGMHKEGVVVFICFVVTGIVAFIDDQKKNLDKTMDYHLISRRYSLALYYLELSEMNSIMGLCNGWLWNLYRPNAAIGILGSAYFLLIVNR